MDSSVSPPEPAPEDPAGLTARKVLRGVAFALIGGAIVVDVFGPPVVRWRRAAAAKAVGWANQVAPTENYLLDAAVELLRATDAPRP